MPSPKADEFHAPGTATDERARVRDNPVAAVEADELVAHDGHHLESESVNTVGTANNLGLLYLSNTDQGAYSGKKSASFHHALLKAVVDRAQSATSRVRTADLVLRRDFGQSHGPSRAKEIPHPRLAHIGIIGWSRGAGGSGALVIFVK